MELRETLEKAEAFEFYYMLGKGRSCSLVAEEFQVSLRTVYNWSRWFNWQKKVRERDIENATKIAQTTNETIVRYNSFFTCPNV